MISNKDGELLFYTNGIKVWNKNHDRMLGFDGVTLIGDEIGTQTSIIIPKPASNSIYYVFTIKTFQNTDINSNISGLYYSIVDMSLNNGLGLLISSNNFLRKNITGKISAVHHKNGKDIWVVTNGKENENERFYDFFYSYLITDKEVEKVVISKNGSLSIFDDIGQMKLSPDGKKLAYAANIAGSLVFKFNDETGIISNPRRLAMATAPGDRTFPFGVEFSVDSRFLYFDVAVPNGNSRLYQFDLLKDRNSYVFLMNRKKFKGALQLGKDGKIYNALSAGDGFFEGIKFLSVINKPDGEDINEINLVESTISLDLGFSRLGLPNFIQSYFRTRIITEKGCLNKSTLMEIDSYTNIDSAEWDFGDGNTSNDITPNHIFKSLGVFIVTAEITFNNSKLVLTKKVKINQIPKLKKDEKLIQCDIDSDGITNFNLFDIKEKITDSSLNESLSFYETFNDAEDNINKITSPLNYENATQNQEIFVRVTNKNDCFEITSFILEAKFTELKEIQDIVVCEDSNGKIGDKRGSKSTQIVKQQIISNLNLSKTINLRFFKTLSDVLSSENEFINNIESLTSEIWVKLEDESGCGGIGKFNFIVNQLPIINLQENYTICYNPNIKPAVTILANATNNRFEWKNSFETILSTNQDFTLRNTGIFSLTVYKIENGIECSNTTEFSVTNPDKPIFSKITVNTEDETNNIIEVEISGNSTYEFSLDNDIFFSNSIAYTFTKVTPGLRTIYVRDIDNCESSIEQKVSVLGVQDFFTPNGDGKNDFWNIRGLNAQFYKSINIKIFDRLGRIVGSITDFDTPGWDGRYGGKIQISNSYWFKVEIIDIDDNFIKKTGNFSLIRK